ncbi:MAG: hypothetical protein ACKO9F_08445 [Caldilinea sp.]
MQKRTQRTRYDRSGAARGRGRRPLVFLLGGLLLAGAAGAGLLWLMRPAPAVDTSAVVAPAVATASVASGLGDESVAAEQQPSATPLAIGPVNTCVAQPQFLRTLNLGDRPIIGTGARMATGFVVMDPESGQIYQDPTWDDAGDLGPYVYDRRGNFYVGPSPRTNLALNPVDKQNIVYRIDSQSAVMAPYLTLPAGLPPSSSNPFGTMGIAYDCETESLYVTSVAGSTATEEVGRLYRIDLTTGLVVDQLDGFDGFGVSVFNGVEGKTLYLGSARRSEVYTVTLDAAGNFVGLPQLYTNTTALAGGDSRKVRRIQFTPDNRMVWSALDFDFTLRAASVTQETVYHFVYEAAQGAWVLEKVEAIER